MKGHAAVKARVVDLLRFKAERGQRRLEFDEGWRPARPSFGVVEPFRPLTPRQVAHRVRMHQFLAARARADA